MSSNPQPASGDDPMTEHCEDCGTDTPHDVRVEILEESPHADFSIYSREPYRIKTCRTCGVETAKRMNNE